MKPRAITFLFLTLLLTVSGGCSYKASKGYTPKLTSINIVDRNGLSETLSSKDRLDQYERTNFLAPQPYQKVMRIYNRMPNGDILACITSYNPNGQIRQYLEILNNRAHGAYREWHENGQVKIEATLVGGVGDIGTAAEKTWLFDGTCRAWDEDGHLEAEIAYKKGILENESVYFHKNGEIWKKGFFEKGILHGPEAVYLEDGQLLETNYYSFGEKNGACIRYWNGSKIASKEHYDKGILMHGYYYDSNGNLITQVVAGEGKKAIFGIDRVVEFREYHDGVVDGKVEILNSDGSLFNIYHVKEGFKHGEEIEYYPKRAGQRKQMAKISLNWNQGVIQGTVKTWYSNGKQESQKEMSKNEKNGLATAWYEDGSIMMIEEYDHDTLVNGKYLKKGQNLPVSKVRDGNGSATLFDSQGNFVRKVNYYNGKAQA